MGVEAPHRQNNIRPKYPIRTLSQYGTRPLYPPAFKIAVSTSLSFHYRFTILTTPHPLPLHEKSCFPNRERKANPIESF
ncbi:hypothetical protein CEXT_485941 [Caerostris extrusa]|uniref:Uncharacterized protein n=1 Tax=Caerostris extrusa TaxID=172846 RepID=A0AAV4TFW1_CAEEX|nr:hypothetical protein CEXT_485941 [Caerostris extrusa]